MTENVVWHKGRINRDDRCRILGHENKVIWMTGLSGSGKSTIAHGLEEEFAKKGRLCFVLDGDNVRHGLNSDLQFSENDRIENIRRISEVAKLFYDAGVTTIVSFISPYQKDRETARILIGKDFVEVFVDCPLEECEKRDPKGMYKKARRGEIKNFTGIDDLFEAPSKPELHLDTKSKSVKECVKEILDVV